MEIEKKKSMLEYALGYRKQGYSVIPIKTQTKEDKGSLINWKDYQYRLPTEEEIKQWWSKWPEANIAIVTGKISDLVVLDLDIKHGRSSKEFQIPITASAKTGSGGEHFFFKYPKTYDVRNNAGQIDGLGVDVRGDGGIIIVAPSKFKDSDCYEWIIGLEDHITEVPEWLEKKIRQQSNPSSNFDSNKLWKEGFNGVSEGMRNSTATSIAGLCHSNLPKNYHWIIPDILNSWNKKNNPPLEDSEIRSICESVSRYKKDVELKNIKPITFGELKKLIFPEAEWRIKSIIPKQGVAILASPSGVAKTWVALGMSLSIAKGEKFLDKDEFQSLKGRVLYLDAEMGYREIQRRCFQLGYLNMNEEDNFHFLNSYDFNLNSIESIQEIEEYISENNIDVLIIDTFRPFASGVDENSGQDVRQFFQRFYTLRDKGVSVVILDHIRKKGPTEPKRPTKEKLIGSQDKMASADVGLMLYEDDRNDIIEIHQVKNRFSPESDPIGFKLIDTEDESGKVLTKMEYSNIQTDEEDKLENARDLIVEFISDNGPQKRKDIITHIKECNIGETVCDRARKQLMEEGIIEERKNGRITEYYVSKESTKTLKMLSEEF